MSAFGWRKPGAIALVTVLAACAPDGRIAGPDEDTGTLATDLVESGLIGDALDDISGLVGQLLPAVVRLSPLAIDAIATKDIGPAGGVVRAGGVELRVPRGALKTTTSITLVVPAGTNVLASFFPHGLRFDRPVELRFDLKGTSAANATAADLVGTFFTTPILRGLIQPEEVFKVDVQSGVVRFDIRHFSEYAPARRGYTAAGG